MARDGWKWLNMSRNGLTWLEMSRMAINCWIGMIWLVMAGNC